MKRISWINVGNIAWIIVSVTGIQLHNAECQTGFNRSFGRNVACIFCEI